MMRYALCLLFFLFLCSSCGNSPTKPPTPNNTSSHKKTIHLIPHASVPQEVWKSIKKEAENITFFFQESKAFLDPHTKKINLPFSNTTQINIGDLEDFYKETRSSIHLVVTLSKKNTYLTLPSSPNQTLHPHLPVNASEPAEHRTLAWGQVDIPQNFPQQDIYIEMLSQKNSQKDSPL